MTIFIYPIKEVVRGYFSPKSLFLTIKKDIVSLGVALRASSII
jgi:hypothetical protein